MPANREYPFVWATVLAVFDATCMFAAFLVALAATKPGPAVWDRYFLSHAPYFLVLLGIWAFQAIDQRLWVSRRGDRLIPQLFSFTKTVVVSIVLCLFVLALLYREDFHRTFALGFAAITLLFMLFFRTTLRLGVWGLRRRGYNYRRILMVGANERALKVAEIIDAQRHYGYQIVGVLDDDPARAKPFERFGIDYLGGLPELDKLLVASVVDVVYICLPVKSHYETIQSAAHLCEGIGVPVRLVADLFPLKVATSELMKLGDIPLLALSTSRDLRTQRALQRTTDIVVSSILLAMVSPLMLAIAAAIKFDSPGPVFGLHRRVGPRSDTPFDLIRFRTAPHPPGNGRANEPLTRVGRILKQYNLDELPELFNIWLGQMSLSEPRPRRIDEPESSDTPVDATNAGQPVA